MLCAKLYTKILKVLGCQIFRELFHYPKYFPSFYNINHFEFGSLHSCGPAESSAWPPSCGRQMALRACALNFYDLCLQSACACHRREPTLRGRGRRGGEGRRWEGEQEHPRSLLLAHPGAPLPPVPCPPHTQNLSR